MMTDRTSPGNTSTQCASGEPCRLSRELARLKAEVAQLSTLVSTDPLTGLFNYRYFSDVMAQEIERSQRTRQPTSLVMLDADHFKRVNDTWGHETGNLALQMIARQIKRSIRKLDIPCRYGGEEFAIIFPSTDITTAIQVAERIRLAIAGNTLTLHATDKQPTLKQPPHTLNLTVSLGISSYYNSKNDDWHKLVKRADEQLYQAKQNGRNCICHSRQDHQEQQVSKDEKAALFDLFQATPATDPPTTGSPTDR